MIKYIRVTLWGRLYVTLKEMHCLIGFASEAEGKSQFKKKKLIQYCSGRRPPPGSRIGISPPQRCDNLADDQNKASTKWR